MERRPTGELCSQLQTCYNTLSELPTMIRQTGKTASSEEPLSPHLALSQFGGRLLSIFAKSGELSVTELNDNS